MNFERANALNRRMNLLSGNLLPIIDDRSAFPLGWRVYTTVVWIIELIHTIALACGIVLTSREEALKNGTVCVVVTLEAFFMLTRLYTRKRLLKRVIGSLNILLRDADETMKDIVKSTLNPIAKPFTIYGIISVVTITIWTVEPVKIAFDRDAFYYVDYNLPAAFAAEPFSRVVLIASTVLMTTGSVLLFLKKYSVDIYMIHLVLMMTVQYRYTAKKLKLLFQDLQKNVCDKNFHFGTDHRRIEKKLRALCQHHNTVLGISFMLRELLSVNFSLLFVNSVFRFCFVGVMLSTIPSLPMAERISPLFFAVGSAWQFFLLCSSVQTLSDSSTEITDSAFDESWYQCSSSVKRTFLLLIMANNLECKIAAIDKINLSLPSFMTIMNQSYSIALLFLRKN